MKNAKAKDLIFIALCSDIGLIAKRLISPFANVFTDFLRIPGGIGTGFSLLFLVIGAELVPLRGCAALMGFVQSMIMLALGMTGSMGALSPIGYIVPGIVIDLVFALGRKHNADKQIMMILANMLASASAGLTANVIVFNLRGIPLALYVTVALISGGICGQFAYILSKRLAPLTGMSEHKRIEYEEVK
ncbi:MAG: hypothetical protein IKR11_05990 [Solobacterium sp.]|nr:hypothetical protein [Solobacterium sp.]